MGLGVAGGLGILCEGDAPRASRTDAVLLGPRLTSRGGAAPLAGLHGRGVRLLLDRRPELAVETLLRAASREDPDPRILSDLSAAYLLRSQEPGRRHDAVLALEAAERALAGADVVEARFNRALALQRLGLVSASRRAWDDYRARDPASGWGRHAQGELAAIDAGRQAPDIHGALLSAAHRGDPLALRRLLAQSPHAGRRLADALLAEWAGAAAPGCQGERLLGALRLTGQTLRDRHRDVLVEDAVLVLERAAGDPARVRALAAGHRRYAEGRKLFDDDDYAAAAGVLADAARRLGAAGSPFRFVAELDQARALHYDQRIAGAAPILDRLQREVSDRRYPHLAGQVRRCLGLVEVIRRRLDRSLVLYRSAESLLAATEDLEWLSHVRWLIAENLVYLGLDLEAWSDRVKAVAGAVQARAFLRQASVLGEMARTLEREGQGRAAAIVHDEAVEAATRAADPPALAGCLLRRAAGKRKAGDEPGADLDFRLAREAAASVADGKLRDRILADIAVNEAAAAAETDPRLALSRLDEARRLYGRIDVSHRDGAIWDIGARAWLALGELEQAELWLRRALRAVEQEARNLSDSDPGLRIAHAELVGQILDRMVELQAVHLHRPRRALLFAERGRAQVLLEGLRRGGPSAPAAGGGPAALSDVETIRRGLPPGAAMLIYAVLPRHLLLWVVRSSGITLYESGVTADRIAALVSAFRSRLARAAPLADLEDAARELHGVLIAPAAAGLLGLETLVVVPHRSLGEMPFAALLDGTTRRYLVQDHRIVMAPSAAVWLACAARERRLGGGPFRSALVFGNPTFDTAALGLPPLPQAEAEARQVARLYPRARLLVGPAATADQLVEHAPAHEILHFAGHAISNAASPELSLLVTASAPGAGKGGSAVVYPAGLTRWRLGRTRLVFLSACQTGTGRIYGSEGVMSIARSFLIAGAPVVVATMAAVEDRPAREFAVAVHERLARGEDAATAVRGVQLRWIADAVHRQRHLSTWSAFTVVGAAEPGRPSSPERTR